MKDTPLAGKTVVITRPDGQHESLATSLAELGAQSLVVPVIRIVPPDDWQPIDESITAIQSFHWIIFTSANGVRIFFDRLTFLEKNISQLQDTQVVAIGPATAHALEQHGITPDKIPSQFVSDSIPEILGNISGQNILLPRADIARKELAERLKELGANVTCLALYRIQEGADESYVEMLRELPDHARPDYITFTSSSTVRGFLATVKRAGRTAWLSTIPLVSIGPITAETVHDLGYQVAKIADQYTADGLVQALLEISTQSIQVSNCEGVAE